MGTSEVLNLFSVLELFRCTKFTELPQHVHHHTQWRSQRGGMRVQWDTVAPLFIEVYKRTLKKWGHIHIRNLILIYFFIVLRIHSEFFLTSHIHTI
jgi:hypothetical protein